MNALTCCMNEWEELLLRPLNTSDDLVRPSNSSPHRQLMHLFTSVYKTKVSHSYRQDIKSTFKYVSEYMEAKFGNKPLYLKSSLDEFSLNEFHTFLKQCMLDGRLHNRYANVLQSTYKNVLNKAIEIKVPTFERFYLPNSFCYYKRVTKKFCWLLFVSSNSTL